MHDVIDKVNHILVEIMSFKVLVRDWPEYKITINFKNENKDKFVKIIRFLGLFHMNLSFIYAIFKYITRSNRTHDATDMGV